MKSLFYTVAAAALTVAAAPSQAAITINYPNGQMINLSGPVNGVYTGPISANVVGSGGDSFFTAWFGFNSPEPGRAGASVTTIALDALSNINFTAISLNGHPGTVVNGVIDQAFILSSLIDNGPNTLMISGNLNPPDGVGAASFGGDLSIATLAAVPEPATWGLFILGFGAIGLGMRRHNAKVRHAKSAIRFA